MDIILDPNVAYLLIVIGFILTIFAIITPGTGLFEVGAVIVLGLAAWRVLELEINVWALFLLIAGIIPFIFAVRNKNRTLNLALTLAAFVIGSAFLFRSEVWWRPAVNPVLAVVTSVAAGSLIWLMMSKVLEAESKPPSHDLSGLVGKVGEARTDIHLEGSVYLQGETWTAESEAPIKAGSFVKVLSRNGFVLKVEETNEPM
ncbi:MAG: NfeD family protein [Anaerolineales bacterium]